MVILIDNVVLKVLKAVPTVQQAEYWAEILIPRNDFLVVGTDNKDFAAYTPFELRKMYWNHTGIMLPDDFPYNRLCSGMGGIVRDMDEDETPVEDLVERLGRELSPIDPTPIPQTPGRKPSGQPTKVNRPKEGSATGKVWAIADSITEETGAEATRNAVIEACGVEGINPSTASTQFAKWRKNYLAELLGEEEETPDPEEE